MLKIFYKVLNEVDFMAESLQSVYPYADQIYILEYCLESMRKIILPSRISDRGLSGDGTTDIIKNFPDPDKKIFHLPIGFLYGAESIPYQMIVDMPEVGDYIWVLDGDIVYSEKLCQNIRAWVDMDYYDAIWVPERVFYHDLYHEKKTFFNHHQRVFKKIFDNLFYYPKCFEVHWVHQGDVLRRFKRDSEFEWDGKKYYTKTADPDIEGIAYHYAYVHDVQKILEKMLWQYDMIDRKWNNIGAREHCRSFKNVLDFKISCQDWFTNIYPETIGIWNQGHPIVMGKNGWIDYHWDEQPVVIAYEDARALVKWPGEC